MTCDILQQIIRVATDGRFVDSMPMPRFAPVTQPYFNSFAARGYMTESPGGGVVFGQGDAYRFTIVPITGIRR
jgi:hypothetical protein